MRVVRFTALPVVLRIQDRDEVMVAVPSSLSIEDVLTLARLVLSAEEYGHLWGHLTGDRREPLASTYLESASVPRDA